MKVIEIVANAGKVVDDVFAAAQDAARKGDVEALYAATKNAAKPVAILKKATAIANNPERYEHAEENFTAATGEIVKMDPRRADAMAKAEALSRLSVAKRRYAAVRTLEKIAADVLR